MSMNCVNDFRFMAWKVSILFKLSTYIFCVANNCEFILQFGKPSDEVYKMLKKLPNRKANNMILIVFTFFWKPFFFKFDVCHSSASIFAKFWYVFFKWTICTSTNFFFFNFKSSSTVSMSQNKKVLSTRKKDLEIQNSKKETCRSTEEAFNRIYISKFCSSLFNTQPIQWEEANVTKKIIHVNSLQP